MNAVGRTRLIGVAVVAVLVAVIALSGFVLPTQQPAARSASQALVGRQLSVCPVERTTGTQIRLGAAVADGLGAGRLTGSPLGQRTDTAIDLDRAGSSVETRPTGPVVLRAEDGFTGGAGGSVFTVAGSGAAAGVSLTGCQTPATQHWFTGVAATAAQTTRLVLSNPDATEAKVDLHFFDGAGPVSAPGSLGLVVPATDTTVVSLSGLLPSGLKGAVAVEVTTSVGRVSAVASSTYRDGVQPAGDATATPMSAPQTSLVIPGVPGGAGSRRLVLANPGELRTTVTVSVLGADGTFAPADNATVDVNAGATAEVALADALDGEPVAIGLTATQPVTAAMVSTTERTDAAPDVAVQTAAGPIRGLGLQPYAFASGLTNTLVVSNAGDQPAQVEVAAVTFAGRAGATEDLTVRAGGTEVYTLPTDASGYVTVRTDATAVYAGVVLSQSAGDTAGLATAPVQSGAVGSVGGTVVFDPRAGA